MIGWLIGWVGPSVSVIDKWSALLSVIFEWEKMLGVIRELVLFKCDIYKGYV